MKKMLQLFFLASLGLMLQDCAEEQSLATEKVQINFTLGDDARNAATLLPEGLKLLVSIDDYSGEAVMDYTEISFVKSGSAFITEPLDLTPGNYMIKDFILVNDEGLEIVYAAPRANTSLADEVDHPLMQKFQLGHNVSEFVLKLLPIATHEAKEFGYSSYRMKTTNMINVVVSTGANKNVSADAFILNGLDTVHQYVLEAKVNHLSFNGDATANYDLVIIKDGYSRYSYPFTMKSLQREQHKKPIEAKLSVAFTMVAVPNSAGYFIMEVEGFPGVGTIVIDWGDGTTDTGDLYATNVREHTYANAGRYFISITGDIQEIRTVSFRGWGASATDRLNLENLPALTTLEFEYTPAPTVVDVSHNHTLHVLHFWSTDVEVIKISSIRPPSGGVEVEGSRYVTTASMDGIFDSYYNYALAGHSVDNTFFSWSYTPDAENYMIIQPVGPPSPATIDKMRILQNVYGADFGPDVDYHFGSGEPW